MTENAIIERLDRIERMTLLAAKNVLTLEDTALLTGYTPKYLRQLVADRDIPHYKRGNRLFFDRSDIEAWMKEHPVRTRNELKQLI